MISRGALNLGLAVWMTTSGLVLLKRQHMAATFEVCLVTHLSEAGETRVGPLNVVRAAAL